MKTLRVCYFEGFRAFYRLRNNGCHIIRIIRTDFFTELFFNFIGNPVVSANEGIHTKLLWGKRIVHNIGIGWTIGFCKKCHTEVFHDERADSMNTIGF